MRNRTSWEHRKGSRPQHNRGRFLQTIPKTVRLVLVAIVSLCAFAGFFQGGTNYLDQLKKAYPTNFSRLYALDSFLWSPIHPIRYNNGTHIDDRYTYISHLGSGKEGNVSLYGDREGIPVAVKTFSLSSRNDIPLELAGDFIDLTTAWPTEIEAGILLNSLRNFSFVPVLDFFILQDPAGWSWALVSPQVSGGTLISLAGRERAAYSPKNATTLDTIYRQSLESLLMALEDLHIVGLCHDDIKPDNIFIDGDESHWMLGDLGNVREVKHAWHKTSSWTRQNQLADCKTNDVKRALKTYLSFMRSASVDSDAFDKQFWMGKTAWSRMYWDFASYPVDAGRLARLSQMLYPQKDASILVADIGGVGSDESLREATERELTCTTLPRRLWFAKGPRARPR